MRISITFASMNEMKKRMYGMMEYLKRLLGLNKKYSLEETSSEEVQVVYDETTKWQSPLYTFYPIRYDEMERRSIG